MLMKLSFYKTNSKQVFLFLLFIKLFLLIQPNMSSCSLEQKIVFQNLVSKGLFVSKNS